MKRIYLSLCFCLLSMAFVHAQTTDSTQVQEEEQEIDFSQFDGEIEEADGVKRYCSSKVFGISPTKLISLGYDYQMGYQMTSNVGTANEEKQNVNAVHGVRLIANFPVISHNKFTLNIGFNYMEANYSFEQSNLESPLKKSLNAAALRNTGINFTIFKPLNEKNFILAQTNHDLNGDYKLDEWQSPSLIRHSILAVFGWKAHDRLQYGFGAAQTYRVGAMNYIPVILYNFTSENRKWGIEAVFPARVHYRRSFNTRNLLLLGYELEGHTYHLRNRDNVFGNNYNDLELKRSEFRLRAIYERALSDFIWISFQAGYRYNWRNSYNIDRGDFFRSFFSTAEYTFLNTVTNPLYFNISINLVSP